MKHRDFPGKDPGVLWLFYKISSLLIIHELSVKKRQCVFSSSFWLAPLRLLYSQEYHCPYSFLAVMRDPFNCIRVLFNSHWSNTLRALLLQSCLPKFASSIKAVSFRSTALNEDISSWLLSPGAGSRRRVCRQKSIGWKVSSRLVGGGTEQISRGCHLKG